MINSVGLNKSLVEMKSDLSHELNVSLSLFPKVYVIIGNGRLLLQFELVA